MMMPNSTKSVHAIQCSFQLSNGVRKLLTDLSQHAELRIFTFLVCYSGMSKLSPQSSEIKPRIGLPYGRAHSYTAQPGLHAVS